MKLRHVYLVVRDPEALASFYREALGLEVAFSDPGRWVQFATEGSAFCLAGPDEGVEAEGQPLIPVFEVGDLESWEERVRAAGAVTRGLRDMGDHGRVLTARDPSGNVFQLFERRTRP